LEYGGHFAASRLYHRTLHIRTSGIAEWRGIVIVLRSVGVSIQSSSITYLIDAIGTNSGEDIAGSRISGAKDVLCAVLIGGEMRKEYGADLGTRGSKPKARIERTETLPT